MEITTYSSEKQAPFRQLLLPWRMVAQLRQHRELIRQFIVRDVQLRYRGSFLGVLWSLLRPLAMLAVYTVVFGFIFQSKLGNRPVESKLDFVLALFCGLNLFEFFAEVLGRSPSLILGNASYVTKVVFPLEILPISVVGAGLVHLAISSIPLLAGQLIVHHGIPLTALLLPLMLLPLIFLSLGAGWLLSSLGVFVRDIGSTVPVLIQILMFASAIFYSFSQAPQAIQQYLMFNPLAVIINQAREVTLWGLLPSWPLYLAMLGVGVVFLVIGYAFFMHTKRAFADVM